MPRRIVSVALPWLAAEHRLRDEGQSGLDRPFAVAAQSGGALRLVGVNRAAARAGLFAGQGLADARAICPGLLSRPAAPERLDAFLRALTRWAERFSPLVGTDAANALVLDATGCAHLFGGEQAMLEAVVTALAGHGLAARAAMADTRGAAWALAHHGRDTITLAPPGRTRQAIGPLPVAALRLDPDTAAALAKVGLATIEPLTRMPRGALARRFGIEAMRRLDQAMGAEPEPVAPDRPLPAFSARLTLPDPVGLTSDVMAGLERLLERVCRDLETHHMGARTLCLTARRVDGDAVRAQISLARPGRDPMRLRELFRRKVDEMEAGFGIDALRLAATATEALKPAQLTQAHRETEAAKLADLVSRLGNRIGFDAVTRLLPAESHIPERAVIEAPAAHSAAESWAGVPGQRPPRPVTIFPAEPLPEPPGGTDGTTPTTAPGAACSLPPRGAGVGRGPATAPPPDRFRWRGQVLTTRTAHGPERIAPEWWWDDPGWRTGPRDYWHVETAEGPRLWLFHTPARPRWYAQGMFA